MVKNTIKKSGFIAPIVAASLYSAPAQAECADKNALQTKKDLIDYMNCSNYEYFQRNPADPRKKDWDKFVELMYQGEEIVVKQTAQGKTYYGLDGWGQVLDKEHQQLSTKNEKLDLSERIPNYTISHEPYTKPVDAHYAFDGLPLLATSQPDDLQIIVPVRPYPVPGPIQEKEISSGKWSFGTGYLHIFTADEEQYGFDGNLFGGKAWLTFQPRATNWYFGPEVMVYGNESSAEHAVEVPAADGPLAGELVMKGTNQYSLWTLGLGAGFTGGYMIPFEENIQKEFGFGIELHSGIMLDLINRELTEHSANYINEKVVEGTETSNTTSDLEKKVTVYNGLGVKLKLGPFCMGPEVGLRTNFSQTNPVVGVNFGYCPTKE